MEPLHVRFDLLTPLAGLQTRPLYLDGLMTGAHCEVLLAAAEGGGSDDSSFDPFKEALDLSIYLDAHWIDGLPLWKASQLIPSWKGSTQWWTMTRKTDPIQWMWGQDSGLVKSKRALVDLESGQQRNFFWYLPIRVATHVDAWCIGDREEVDQLLQTVKSLGKHRRNGFGVVSKVTVEVDVKAEQRWRWRPLPKGPEGNEMEDASLMYVPSFETISPPYWDALGKKNCRVPILI